MKVPVRYRAALLSRSRRPLTGNTDLTGTFIAEGQTWARDALKQAWKYPEKHKCVSWPAKAFPHRLIFGDALLAALDAANCTSPSALRLLRIAKKYRLVDQNTCPEISFLSSSSA